MNPITEPVKITSLELENVKRIRACAITPTQNGLTVIGGRNNQGKTSVLDAIAWALGGDRHRPSRAAREGSSIPPRLCVKLSNGLVVERTGKNSDLKVTDTEGRRADCIRRAFESRRPARLSQPALEVLAIIAYYQPATRAYVDQIRGVDSSYTVSLLLERDLIEECGRLAVPGRPIQYRTTQTFLRSFGLSNLDELPELPNTTPEDGQLTLEMQAAVERLQAAQAAEGTEEVTEEELLQAAREMAQAEEEA